MSTGYALSFARRCHLTAEREEAQGLVTDVARARVACFRALGNYVSNLDPADAGLCALERVQSITAPGTYAPGPNQERAIAKLDGGWASPRGRDLGQTEPTSEAAFAQIVEAAIDDLAAFEAQKTEAAQAETRTAIQAKKLAEKEAGRLRERITALEDEVQLTRESAGEEVARLRPIAARFNAVLEGLLSPEEAAELTRADLRDKAEA